MSDNNTNRRGSSLLDKAVDIEPTGVIYNIMNDTVESFVEEYLTKKGVDGIAAVKLQVRNEGRANPEVALYLFVNQQSKSIVSEIGSVPPILRSKVDKINVRMGDEFKKILYPLCGNNIESGRADGRDYFVKLNVFRAVGIMLAVDPSRHSLVISDAKRLPNGNSVISVVKGENYNSFGGGNGDRYNRQIDYLEKRH